MHASQPPKHKQEVRYCPERGQGEQFVGLFINICQKRVDSTKSIYQFISILWVL